MICLGKSAMAAMLIAISLATRPAAADLIPADNGLGVYDTSTGFTWLANADLAAAHGNLPGQTFNLPVCSASFTSGTGPAGCITANGMMDYQTALTWVRQLNQSDYGGHENWQLPVTTSPPTTKASSGCSAEGALGGGYGFHCTDSALSNLYYGGLNGTQRNSIQPAFTNTINYFSNIQPNFYWTGTPKPPDGANPGAMNAYYTFSFNSGWQGSSVGANDYAKNNIGAAFLYAMAMFNGPPKGMTPDGTNNLQPFAGGLLIYDPRANVTWLADANAGLKLLSLCTRNTYDGCVNSAGAMTWTTASMLMGLLNASSKWSQYLPDGVQWQLPGTGNSSGCNWSCDGDPSDQMAWLFYDELNMTAGRSVMPGIMDTVGPFTDLQPYFYWTCDSVLPGAWTNACSDNPDPLAADQANTFTFDSGFQSTDLTGNVNNPNVARNALFVTAYYVSEPSALPVLLMGLVPLAFILRRRRVIAS